MGLDLKKKFKEKAGALKLPHLSAAFKEHADKLMPLKLKKGFEALNNFKNSTKSKIHNQLLGETSLSTTDVSGMQTRKGLLTAYLKSDEKWKPRLLIGAILPLLVADAALLAETFKLGGEFIDIITEMYIGKLDNFPTEYYADFLKVTLGYGTVYAAHYMLGKYYDISWREWSFLNFMNEYFKNNVSFHHKNTQNKDNDEITNENAEKKPEPALLMTDIIKQYVEKVMELAKEGAKSPITFITMMPTLYYSTQNPSNNIPINILGQNFDPTTLFFFGSIGTAGLLAYSGGKILDIFQEINLRQEKAAKAAEGDLRTTTEQTIEDMESIYLFGNGQEEEIKMLKSAFNKIKRKTINLEVTKTVLNLSTGTIDNIFKAAGAGITVSAFLYGMFESPGKAGVYLATFEHMRAALSFFMKNKANINDAKASSDMLNKFATEIIELKEIISYYEKNGLTAKIKFFDSQGDDIIRIKNLVVAPLFTIPELRIKRGESVMVTGDSGCGKSVLSRILLRKHLLGEGDVYVPPADKIFIATPQAYMKDSFTLRQNLLYGLDNADEFSDEDIKQALRDAKLEDFIDSLNETKHKGKKWKDILSSGQNQRINFARLFLRANKCPPDLIILDEATANMNKNLQDLMYALVKEKFSKTTIYSIVHRIEELAKHHDRHLEFKDNEIIDHSKKSLDEIMAIIVRRNKGEMRTPAPFPTHK